MGAVDSTTQLVGGGAKLATTALSTVQAASAAGLLTLGGTLAAAIPVAGAVISVGLLVFSLLHDSRNAAQKVETTAAVNKGEALIKQNLAAWQASAKSLATQAQALQNFDDAWNAIVAFCGNGNEGAPGQRCVSERQRGGKYDYFALYRDPIASDPAAGLVDQAAAAQSAAAQTATATASIDGTAPGLLIPGLLLAGALLASTGKQR